MAFIARTFIGTQAEADRAYRYFRQGGKLSKIKRIRRGRYEFILHVPTVWAAKDPVTMRTRIELAFNAAFRSGNYETIEIEELPIDVKPEPSKPTPAEALNTPITVTISGGQGSGKALLAKILRAFVESDFLPMQINIVEEQL